MGETSTKLMESSTRKKIDLILKNLGWETDESSPKCNVFTERPKTKEQKNKLAGKKPDYLLYKSGTDEIITVIEAKRPDKKIKVALEKAVNLYAKPLKIPIVFATDGTITETYHVKDGIELKVDGVPVNEFLSEKDLLKFLNTAEIESPTEIVYTKKELIKIFERSNELLRKEGLREGLERFTEFANILFLKLISEIENDRESSGEKRILEKKYCWESFADLDGERMLEYINNTILPKLVDKYNHSGDVFEEKLKITNPNTLKEIVGNLSRLKLINVDSDIKGDAFEYFLKNSVTVGNDLGEYFTPRHIVKLMVKLVDPKFGETVYDPSCGTAGFLIEAFQHIKKKCKQTRENLDILKKKTIYGRELTGTAKIAKMNMIITGDGHNNIKQVDSLKSPVKEKYNIVLTNFPFSQETDFGYLYGFDTKDANPVFLKHIIDALEKGGRAGVIVFQGILYDNMATYHKIRKYLLENCEVEAVIKLHNYVFKPYAGANTSIIIFKKGEPTTKPIWFFNVGEDGFEKTSSIRGRKPIDKNDLKLLMEIWSSKETTEKSWSVVIEEIRKNNYILNAETYKPNERVRNKIPMVSILSVADLVKDTVKPFQGKRFYLKTGNLKKYDMEKEEVTYQNRPSRANLEIDESDVIFAKMKNTNKNMIVTEETKDLIVSTGFFVLRSKNTKMLNPEFLKYMVSSKSFLEVKDSLTHGSTQEAINDTDIGKIKIPLPSLKEQNNIVQKLKKQDDIVSKINEVEKSIYGVGIDDSLFEGGKEKTLRDVTKECLYGTSELADANENSGIPILRMNNISYDGQIDVSNLKYIKLSEKNRGKYLLKDGDVLFNRTNSRELVGKTCCFDLKGDFVYASYLIRLRLDTEKVIPKYVSYFLNSNQIKELLSNIAKPSVNMANINAQELLSIRIKIPSMEKQQETVEFLDSKFEAIKKLDILKSNAEKIIENSLEDLWHSK